MAFPIIPVAVIAGIAAAAALLAKSGKLSLDYVDEEDEDDALCSIFWAIGQLHRHGRKERNATVTLSTERVLSELGEGFLQRHDGLDLPKIVKAAVDAVKEISQSSGNHKQKPWQRRPIGPDDEVGADFDAFAKAKVKLGRSPPEHCGCESSSGKLKTMYPSMAHAGLVADLISNKKDTKQRTYPCPEKSGWYHLATDYSDDIPF